MFIYARAVWVQLKLLWSQYCTLQSKCKAKNAKFLMSLVICMVEYHMGSHYRQSLTGHTLKWPDTLSRYRELYKQAKQTIGWHSNNCNSCHRILGIHFSLTLLVLQLHLDLLGLYGKVLSATSSGNHCSQKFHIKDDFCYDVMWRMNYNSPQWEVLATQAPVCTGCHQWALNLNSITLHILWHEMFRNIILSVQVVVTITATGCTCHTW